MVEHLRITPRRASQLMKIGRSEWARLAWKKPAADALYHGDRTRYGGLIMKNDPPNNPVDDDIANHKCASG